MARSGSFTSNHSPAARLTSIISYLRSPRYRVVVCRNLGPDVMPLLESRHELEVCSQPRDAIWAGLTLQWLVGYLAGGPSMR